MSETPERIWAFAPDIFDNLSVWQDAPSPAGDTIEYVRVDMLQQIFDRYSKAEADRIEELSNCVAVLEAKLAKALDTLQAIDDVINARSELFTSDRDLRDNVQDRIRIALAELTGGKDAKSNL